jgi:hypothetical protein
LTSEVPERVACPVVPIENPAPNVYKACDALLPLGWIEKLEQNQLIPSCCRHPENHSIGAFYSSAEDEDLGVPDIYLMFCPCGAVHRTFCTSNPRTAGMLIWAAPWVTSASAEALRPKWSMQ